VARKFHATIVAWSRAQTLYTIPHTSTTFGRTVIVNVVLRLFSNLLSHSSRSAHAYQVDQLKHSPRSRKRLVKAAGRPFCNADTVAQNYRQSREGSASGARRPATSGRRYRVDQLGMPPRTHPLIVGTICGLWRRASASVSAEGRFPAPRRACGQQCLRHDPARAALPRTGRTTPLPPAPVHDGCLAGNDRPALVLRRRGRELSCSS